MFKVLYFLFTFAIMLQEDEQFMARALQLAQLGKATVSPNPMVGCVIVHNGTIIGEGWHQKAGEAHAEVRAIQAVKNEELLSAATVYVTLEPCAHFGKTPPCVELLIQKRVKKVVIGCTDPNPLVAGKGIERLREENIETAVGILENKCLAVNKAFFTAINQKRPYVTLKWAQTADGFIARANYDAKWISSSLSRQLVHKIRTHTDAILVGKNTVKYDNPQLNTREWAGKSPIRLIIDHQCSLSAELNVFDQTIPTFVFNLNKDDKKDNLQWIKLEEENFLGMMIDFLHKEKIQSVLVEGGSKTLEAFIEADLWDEVHIFTSKESFGDGISAPLLKGAVLTDQKFIEGDALNIYYKSPDSLKTNLNFAGSITKS